ncbi:hypothetical protein GLOTRDRAFT_103658 [Gloeophyllum trabeum ATCC 11539]|uniref:Uncharacterized protein n=1 Tax=Gloeophyllum trabeum (strain ATCC 11539 / FP-39264 / Madison 617) TaxID=670483 RepID=S7S2A9_GLOTA|nr:uncharacterized protein GLOTRDRAFT_103658 [Gloeophyllum trabeum ATCC 11539]EPQ59904.1 hypothetical protein GLOTRDRAFT_103658 [Gloeophyllum trabeum ATCC 11539]
MRCNWSAIANAFHRLPSCGASPLARGNIAAANISRNALALSRHLPGTLSSRRHRRGTSSPAPSIYTPSRSYATATLAFTPAPGPTIPEKTPEPLPEPRPAQLTDAQISRAASQAVRLCFKEGQIRDAFFILNSMALAQYKNASPGQVPPKLRQLPDPIDFSRPVSQRLTAHCVLHGLIRAGLSKKAVKEAHSMMEGGIKLRAATMKAIIDALTMPGKAFPMHGAKVRRLILDLARTPEGPEVLKLRSSMVTDQTTRMAVRFFLEARKYGHQRTNGMYESLINACLLQGEILVACLLFVLLVKDWQIRKAITEQVIKSMSEANDAADEKAATRVHIPKTGRMQLSPFPSQGILRSILNSISACWDDIPSNDNPTHQIRSALQALANLATLLNDKLLPFSDISRLVKTMYSVPRYRDIDVWVDGPNGPRRVEAYSYIHSALRRLFDNLPHSYNHGDSRARPPLNMNTYNSLLYYALRHRQSFGLANKVLDHMQRRRSPPLQPNRDTLNILIRAGTVLRVNGLTEQALEELRRWGEGAEHRILTLDFPDMTIIGQTRRQDSSQNATDPASSVQVPIDEAEGRSAEHITVTMDDSQLNSETDHSLALTAEIIPAHKPQEGVAPASQGGALHSLPHADSYTVIAYISHLVATGRPHVVADILFQLLPELLIVNHPARASMPYQDPETSQRQRLQRAVSYGPHFFAVVINALRLTGRTGLCERVWLLARQAERASWEPDANVQPWCLPIHAYTAMMQCYAQESKKGLRMKGVESCTEGQAGWTPYSSDHVIGWASFILHRDRLRPHQLSRHDAAEEMGMLLLRSMNSGALAVVDAMHEIKMKTGNSVALQNVSVFQPDARFFNAALDVFSRHPRMCARRPRTSPSHWRRLLRRSIAAYMDSGRVSPGWSPGLQEIAEDLVAAGFAVPVGFQHMLVGKWLPTPSEQTQRSVVDVRPYGYPSYSPSFLAHSIPTSKTRGLPVSKRYSRNRRTAQS